MARIGIQDYTNVMGTYGADPMVFLSLGADSVSDGAIFVLDTPEGEKFICFIRQNRQDFILFEKYAELFVEVR